MASYCVLAAKKLWLRLMGTEQVGGFRGLLPIPPLCPCVCGYHVCKCQLSDSSWLGSHNTCQRCWPCSYGDMPPCGTWMPQLWGMFAKVTCTRSFLSSTHWITSFGFRLTSPGCTAPNGRGWKISQAAQVRENGGQLPDMTMPILVSIVAWKWIFLPQYLHMPIYTLYRYSYTSLKD